MSLGKRTCSLRVSVFDLRLPTPPGTPAREAKHSSLSLEKPEREKDGSKRKVHLGAVLRVSGQVLPRQGSVYVPLEPTSTPSQVIFDIENYESEQLEVDIVHFDTGTPFGTLRIPLQGLHYVQHNISIGPCKYYQWSVHPSVLSSLSASMPSPLTALTGELKLGLKLVKEQTTVRRIGEWKGKSAGGSIDKPTWVHCPQYLLSLSLSGCLTLSLRSHVGREHPIGFYFLKVGEPNDMIRRRKLREDDKVKHGDLRSWFSRPRDTHVTIDLYVEAGYYIVLPVAREAGVEGAFQLSVCAEYDCGVKLETFAEDELTLISDDEPDESGVSGVAAVDSELGDTGKPAAPKRPPPLVPREDAVGGDESGGEKRLLRAASIGNLRAVRERLGAAGAAGVASVVDTRDRETGAAPLHLAAGAGHLGVVSLLLEKGADPAGRDNHGNTAVMKAAEGGHLPTVKLLVEHARGAAVAAEKNGDGQTVLHFAAAGGSKDVVAYLLGKAVGCAVDEVDMTLQTPLMKAARHARTDVVALLIEKGAVVTRRDRYGMTALHHAAAAGGLETVKLLLAKGAAPNERDRAGESPLYKAAAKGHLDIVRLLLDKGGDDAAHAVALSQDWECIGFLVEHSMAGGGTATASSSASNSLGDMEATARRPRVDILHVLSKNGIYGGASVLQVVSVDSRVQSFRLLFERTAPVSTKLRGKDREKEKEKLASLCRPAAAGQLEILALLVQRGDLMNFLKMEGGQASSASSSGTPRGSPLQIQYDIIEKHEFERLFRINAALTSQLTSATAGSNDPTIIGPTLFTIAVSANKIPYLAYVLDLVETVHLSLVDWTSAATAGRPSTAVTTKSLRVRGVLMHSRTMNVAQAEKSNSASSLAAALGTDVPQGSEDAIGQLQM